MQDFFVVQAGPQHPPLQRLRWDNLLVPSEGLSLISLLPVNGKDHFPGELVEASSISIWRSVSRCRAQDVYFRKEALDL